MEVSENGETSRMVHEGQDRSLRVNKSINGCVGVRGPN